MTETTDLQDRLENCLNRLTSLLETASDLLTDPDNLVYDMAQLSRALHVNPHIIREWMARHDHPLPSLRSRGRVIFPRDLIRRWLAEEATSTLRATGNTAKRVTVNGNIS